MKIGKTLVLASLVVALVAGGDVVSFAQSGGAWKELSMTGYAQRVGYTISAVNGKLYVIGGFYSGQPKAVANSISVYDPTADSWSEIQPSGAFVGRFYHTATVLDGKIYVFGGKTYDSTSDQSPEIASLQIFDPSTNTWSTPSTTGSSPIPRYLNASASADGKVYLFEGGSSSSDIDIFDPETTSFETIPGSSMGYWYFDRAKAFAINDKIWVISGLTQSGYYDSVQVFDPRTRTWSAPPTPTGPTGRYLGPMAEQDGKIYIMISWSGYPETRTYDPTTNTVQDIGASFIGQARATASAAGKMYLMSGVSNSKLQTEADTLQVFIPGGSGVSTSTSPATIELSPNPVTAKLHLSKIGASTREITVRNLLGERLLSVPDVQTDEMTLDVSRLAAGMYWLECGDNSTAIPFVKQ